MLFHGSNTEIKDGLLKPNISFDYKPLVYATEDVWYALVRCGRFDIEDIAIKEDYIGICAPYTLIELRENAFKDIFDTPGYIYRVNKEYFTEQNGEYVSENEVPIHNVICIRNVWNEMQLGVIKGFYRLVEYKDSDEYFKKIGCDKEKYLQRRKDRVEKILRMRKETENIGAEEIYGHFSY